MASLGSDVAILLAGTAEANRWSAEHPSQSLDARSASAEGSDFSGMILKAANLAGATFTNCTFAKVNFDEALLAQTRFINCDLRGSTFRNTDVSTVSMVRCQLDNTDFVGTKHFSQIGQIDSCYLTSNGSDVTFSIRGCRWQDRLLPWSRVRIVGQLRLFLPSYGALILSILALTLAGLINERLESVRAILMGLVQHGIITMEISQKLFEFFQPWTPSWRHLAILISTAALAVGATLYLWCPSRIKEFTLDQWIFSASRPSFEYHVVTWRYPHLRLLCSAAYLFGAIIALILLAETFIRATKLIIIGLTS